MYCPNIQLIQSLKNSTIFSYYYFVLKNNCLIELTKLESSEDDATIQNSSRKAQE